MTQAGAMSAPETTGAQEEFADRAPVCVRCKDAFTFSAGEQRFYRSNRLEPPKHCPRCRQERRVERAQESVKYLPPAVAAERVQTEIICARCGQPWVVPFVPNRGQNVYCRPCYLAQQS